MMTKRVMTKKFMRETGADKKTAMEYLRKCQWNYGQATLLWYAPDALSTYSDTIREIDWEGILASFAKAVKVVEECAKAFAEIVQSIDWDGVVKKIQEERGESNEDPD